MHPSAVQVDMSSEHSNGNASGVVFNLLILNIVKISVVDYVHN